MAALGTAMGLHLPFIIEAVAALAVAGSVGTGIAMVLPNSKNLLPAPDNQLAIPSANEIVNKQAREAISKANERLTAIRTAADGIRSPHTKRQVFKICEIGDKIVQDFRDDPSDVTHARGWLDVYLDQTLDLVIKYANLSKTGTRNLEAQRVLVDVEKTFDVIEKQSAELLEKLLHNDILGLDVSQAVIRQNLTNEKM